MNNNSNESGLDPKIPARPRILLVDDDADLLHLMSMRLRAKGYDVCAVESAEQARARLPIYRPQVVVTDLKMKGMDGMALFEDIQQGSMRLPVIVLTAHGTIPDAVAATQQGVFSYLTKPFDGSVLLNTLEKALRYSSETLHIPDANEDQAWRQEIISRSQAMEALLQKARAAARTDVSILIQSETGTGKELLARAVHRASKRSENAFLAFNCAAIPEPLLESELFGHSAGAFTGATRAHDGLFLAANHGTLFLDEIGDMPLSAQAKLLRVLEAREVRPIGSTRSIPVDVRIIAATHHDLVDSVAKKTFREDLYYRLNVISLELPPLARRREDIPLLVEHFSQMIALRSPDGMKLKFAPEAMELLVSAPWPGNVRQLFNIIEQCSVLSTLPLVSGRMIERALSLRPDKLLSLNEARDRFERDYLIRILSLTEGNIALSARLAKRNRSEFYKLLRRHNLEPEQFRNRPGEVLAGPDTGIK